MMNRPRVFHCGVDPCLDDFNNKQAILVHHACVGHPALEICIAFLDEWRADSRSRLGREAKPLELVYVRTRGIAATHDLFSYLYLSLIHISEPTRQAEISYAVFCLKKKNNKN